MLNCKNKLFNHNFYYVFSLYLWSLRLFGFGGLRPLAVFVNWPFWGGFQLEISKLKELLYVRIFKGIIPVCTYFKVFIYTILLCCNTYPKYPTYDCPYPVRNVHGLIRHAFDTGSLDRYLYVLLHILEWKVYPLRSSFIIICVVYVICPQILVVLHIILDDKTTTNLTIILFDPRNNLYLYWIPIENKYNPISVTVICYWIK